MAYQEYKIASGYNSTLSLVNIEDITVSGERFKPLSGVGRYRAGDMRVNANGTYYAEGYASVSWLFAGITRAQYEYLKTTFCSGGYSGLVTINTRLEGDSYVTRNAVMLIPQTADTSRRWGYYTDFELRFTRLSATS